MKTTTDKKEKGEKPAENGKTELVKKDAAQQQSPSERFTGAVLKELGGTGQNIKLTDFQKKLCQNYFIKIDQVLKDAEAKRMKKQEKHRDPVAVTWQNVNMNKLAVDVIAYSAVGLDPAQPNHINMIPYKNNASRLYDIGFIIGYKGLEVKAKKYGLDIPDQIDVEVIYKKDVFKLIKKDKNNDVESVIFEVQDAFDRGEVVGGYYYYNYYSNPKRNRARVFNMADINKRKPEYASVEFWGGEKSIYEDGKVTGKEKVEGWLDEMVYKTVFRAAYNAITVDSEKIDQHYMDVVRTQHENVENKVYEQIEKEANQKTIDIEAEDITNQGSNEAQPEPEIKHEPEQPGTEDGAENGEVKKGPGF